MRHPSAPEAPAAPRMLWLDANRILAAAGVILIHSTANFDGQPFRSPSPWMNLATAFVRSIAELSGAEIFLVLSLFLLAHKLERREPPYGEQIRSQARRLLLPFLAWTAFFAFFRLLKASVFGYSGAIWDELHQGRSWVGYLLIGSAQYHLHFLPTLFFILLFYPCMRMARRYPLLGLLLVPLLYAMDSVQRWAWGYFTDPFQRGLMLQAIKNLGYLGYGLQAFSLHAWWRRERSQDERRDFLKLMLLLVGLAFMTTLVYGASVASEGGWADRNGAPLYAHLLMPVLVFGAFMAAQDLGWSPLFSKLSPYAFGVYLVHPILIDCYDIAAFTQRWSLSPLVMIFSKFALVVPGSFALAYAMGRVKPLAFMIGLEQGSGAKRAPTAPPATRAAAGTTGG